MAGKFETYTGKNGKHYFRLKAGNGEPILQSQGYKAKADCKNGIESVRRNSQDEKRFEAKTSSNDKHYFVLKASNGQVIGTSEMYNSRRAARTVSPRWHATRPTPRWQRPEIAQRAGWRETETDRMTREIDLGHCAVGAER